MLIPVDCRLELSPRLQQEFGNFGASNTISFIQPTKLVATYWSCLWTSLNRLNSYVVGFSRSPIAMFKLRTTALHADHIALLPRLFGGLRQYIAVL